MPPIPPFDVSVHYTNISMHYAEIFESCKMIILDEKNNIFFLFLALLSERLIGELIGYTWSGVRPSSFVVNNFNIFFSKTACPIKAKFDLEPPWVEKTNVCSRHVGHMTKMAATPIYCKIPSKIFFSRTGKTIFTKLGM